MINRSYL